MERKTGIVMSWGKRGFGILRVGPESSLERYFLHVSNIRSGTALPTAGMEVIFEVSDKAVKEGQLPQAIRADIILPEEQPATDDTAAPAKAELPAEGGTR